LVDQITEDDLSSILELARKFGLSTYDSAYLNRAVNTGLALASFDKDLVAAAKLARVEVI
jgi:predicted nucleic acid-binding protein